MSFCYLQCIGDKCHWLEYFVGCFLIPIVLPIFFIIAVTAMVVIFILAIKFFKDLYY